MKRYHILLFILLGCASSFVKAGESYCYCFRVYLKDKGESGYSTEKPERFLSPESIARRAKWGKPITDTDLPIAQAYLDTLSAMGAEPVVNSKWLSTVVIANRDSTIAMRLQDLPMVDSVKWIWKGEREYQAEEPEDTAPLTPTDQPLKDTYGYANPQIQQLNGERLHKAGFRGQGMRIAVIDAGFLNVDRISVFESLKQLGTHNVVFPGQSVFRGDDHGTKVLSCLAANRPGILVGTAPEASYLLIKSEDNRSEYPIEEDYWVSAVEYADSVGVDLISSSLGYFHFDVAELSHSPSELDGKTAHISRAAQMAGDKGILVFCSAGNEGAGEWKKITFPADAPNILAVGAITDKKAKSNFSSIGLTADYRVKPDVVALGSGCCVIDPSGNIDYANGTSFATPILAGLGACLWQSLPWLDNKQIISLLQQSATQHKSPDAEQGYGIPNLYKAYKQELNNGSLSE